MHQNSKVGLFIVGAAKAGTTALQKNLAKHPGLYFSPVKEPHFFSDDIDTGHFRADFRKRTQLDIEHYLRQSPLPKRHQAYIRSEGQYQALFREARPGQVLAEASASYLWSENAARNIQVYNPEARVIILLRNPVERAFSHYLMDLRMGFVNEGFLPALTRDMNQEKRLWGKSSLYVDLGLYFDQVKRYMELIPHSQVLILKHEDLVHRALMTGRTIAQFIGIDIAHLPDLTEMHNRAALPRTSLMTKMSNHPFVQRMSDKTWLRSAKPILSKLVFRKESLPMLSQNERTTAFNYFQEDIEKLEQLLQTDLGQWKIH